MGTRVLLTALCMVVSAGAVAQGGDATVRLDKERFLDKCRGAWAGQMIGVCFGDRYEFRSNAKPIEGPIDPWTPDRIHGALGQDDLYVEMTFLEALEEHGLDITFEQAGQAFAASEYPLWHANRYGRLNVRRGIMPPLSGHPDYNRHADDIDFQIEADLFGILCPGLPQESNRLCDVFGHIMNYGDGVYGGMFVAGMYAAAYFEDEDVEKVVRAGLACIPEASEYHKCISDVLQWHAQHPDDWLHVWHLIEDKWQDDVDCGPGDPFNIDAKLNGAYIVMGLLYGNGDLQKTVEISTRCGQDADCNPSNAAGVLGCMKGYSGIDPAWLTELPAMADKEFSHTRYSFNTLIPACQRLTEQIVARVGGRVEDDAYVIPVQAPRAPETLEQWPVEEQKKAFAGPVPQSEVDLWNPAWKVVACGPDMEPGIRPDHHGRPMALAIHPVSETRPAVLAATLDVPAGDPRLFIEVASDERGDFLLKVTVDGETVAERVIDTQGEWTVVEVDLTEQAGSEADVRLENHATGWSFEAAYFGEIKVE